MMFDLRRCLLDNKRSNEKFRFNALTVRGATIHFIENARNCICQLQNGMLMLKQYNVSTPKTPRMYLIYEPKKNETEYNRIGMYDF